MRLKKVTRLESNILEIIYTSGLFSIYKSAKIYRWVGDWRYTETGKRLPYPISTSISNVCEKLNVGESFFIESSNN